MAGHILACSGICASYTANYWAFSARWYYHTYVCFITTFIIYCCIWDCVVGYYLQPWSISGVAVPLGTYLMTSVPILKDHSVGDHTFCAWLETLGCLLCLGIGRYWEGLPGGAVGGAAWSIFSPIHSPTRRPGGCHSVSVGVILHYYGPVLSFCWAGFVPSAGRLHCSWRFPVTGGAWAAGRLFLQLTRLHGTCCSECSIPTLPAVVTTLTCFYWDTLS
jgi:hypothetical protein